MSQNPYLQVHNSIRIGDMVQVHGRECPDPNWCPNGNAQNADGRRAIVFNIHPNGNDDICFDLDLDVGTADFNGVHHRKWSRIHTYYLEALRLRPFAANSHAGSTLQDALAAPRADS